MAVSHWFEFLFQSQVHEELNCNISTEMGVDTL